MHVAPYDGMRAHVGRPAIQRLPEPSDDDRHTGGLRTSREQGDDVARAPGVLQWTQREISTDTYLRRETATHRERDRQRGECMHVSYETLRTGVHLHLAQQMVLTHTAGTYYMHVSPPLAGNH